MPAFCASSWANNIGGEKAQFDLWMGTIPKLEGEGFSPGAAQLVAFGGQEGSGTLGTAVVLKDGGPLDSLILYLKSRACRQLTDWG